MKDASQDVRAVARTIKQNLTLGTPVKSQIANIQSDGFHSVKVRRSVPKLESSLFEISHVMPPYNRESGNAFCEILNGIVKAEAFGSLDGLQFALSDSILAAWRFGCDFTKIIEILPHLFDEFGHEVGECIAEIIAAANCNGRVIQKAISKFGIDFIVANFVKSGNRFPSETIAFFVVITQKKIINELGERLRKFLLPLLGESDTENARLLREMIDLEEERDSLENMILDGVLPKNSESVERGIDVIMSLLGNESTSELALAFVIDAIEQFGQIELSALLPALFELLRPGYAKADVCVRMVIRRCLDLVPFVIDERHRENAVMLLAWFLLRNRENIEFDEGLLRIGEILVKLVQDGRIDVCRSACVCLGYLMCGAEVAVNALNVKLHVVQQVMVGRYKIQFVNEPHYEHTD
jgi:hypothetical protein